jgi:hypothetical protein
MHTWVDNIKTDLKEKGFAYMNCIHLAPGRLVLFGYRKRAPLFHCSAQSLCLQGGPFHHDSAFQLHTLQLGKISLHCPWSNCISDTNIWINRLVSLSWRHQSTECGTILSLHLFQTVKYVHCFPEHVRIMDFSPASWGTEASIYCGYTHNFYWHFCYLPLIRFVAKGIQTLYYALSLFRYAVTS